MECVVCQDFFNADTMVPRVLSCGHSFCSNCVKLMLTHGKDCVLSCIVCKLPHYALVESPLQVPYNFALLDLMFAGGHGGTPAVGGRGNGRGGGGPGGYGPGGGGPGGYGPGGGGPGGYGPGGGGPGGYGAVGGVPGEYGAVGGNVPSGFGAVGGNVPGGFGAVAGGPVGYGAYGGAALVGMGPAGQGILQMVPPGGTPAPYGRGGAALQMYHQPQAGRARSLPSLPVPMLPGQPMPQSMPPPMSPLRQAIGGSPRPSPPSSNNTSSSSDSTNTSDDEYECPNVNRELNAPKPIGEQFTVTLQLTPGMEWKGGKLCDGNEAFNRGAKRGAKRSGRNRNRNRARGRGGSGSSGEASGQQDPPTDSDEDFILDYVPILGPKPPE